MGRWKAQEKHHSTKLRRSQKLRVRLREYSRRIHPHTSLKQRVTSVVESSLERSVGGLGGVRAGPSPLLKASGLSLRQGQANGDELGWAGGGGWASPVGRGSCPNRSPGKEGSAQPR